MNSNPDSIHPPEREEEEWRDVVAFPGYEVSSLGRVRSWMPMRNFAPVPDRPHVLKPGFDKDGYARVVLRRSHIAHEKRVHVLVCEAWNGPANAPMCLHKDGNHRNNSPENLYWGNAKQNTRDSHSHGTFVHGERVNTAKLTAQDVLAIHHSNEHRFLLANRYHVTVGTIHHIKQKRTWKHVPR